MSSLLVTHNRRRTKPIATGNSMGARARACGRAETRIQAGRLQMVRPGRRRREQEGSREKRFRGRRERAGRVVLACFCALRLRGQGDLDEASAAALGVDLPEALLLASLAGRIESHQCDFKAEATNCGRTTWMTQSEARNREIATAMKPYVYKRAWVLGLSRLRDEIRAGSHKPVRRQRGQYRAQQRS